MAPTAGARASSAFVYLVSCLFFLSTLAGGALLLLYITLPEGSATSWLPVAGIVLVGIPWIFWTLTCVYRLVTCREPASDADAPAAAAAVATTPVAATSVRGGGGDEGCSSPVDSTGGTARRVRFGAATVIGGQEGNANAGGMAGGSGDGGAGTSKTNDRDGDSSAAGVSSVDESSLTSRESEVPLVSTS